MISKKGKHCNVDIIWPEIWAKEQRLPNIADGHTRLIAKLIQRIDRLEKKVF